MKYFHDIGDAVVVKSDLHTGIDYYMKSGPETPIYNNVTEEMKKYAGKIVHIADHISGQYLIKEDDYEWIWTDDMFENVSDEECFCVSLL